jgi:uncharacterized glyoxalase superfamily protein PhnB
MAYELKKLTPNLIVSSVEQSLAFYCDVLGFSKVMTVPDQPPFVFAIVQTGPVEIFFNAIGAATEEYPEMAGKPLGGTLTLYCEVSDIERVYAELKDRVKVTMPLQKKWYGVTEFAFEDPDGYVMTFGQPNE